MDESFEFLSMSANDAILAAFGICLASIGVEAFIATRTTRRLRAAHRPAFAPQTWTWSVVAALYYIICFSLFYRLFRIPDTTSRDASIGFAFLFVALNSLWNFTFFRLEDLRYSFGLTIFYTAVAFALFICLLFTDILAFFTFVPYIIYLVLGNYWGYPLVKLSIRR